MKTSMTCTLAALAVAVAVPAQAQTASPAQPAAPAPQYGAPITHDRAERIADGALAAAAARNFTMAVAIVDTHGELVAFHRMDNTQYASNAVALQKARTAAMFKRPTKSFYDAVAGGRVATLSVPGVIAIEGGVPIVEAGRIIGAIGVSGGTSVEDGEIAAAALAASAR